MWNNNEVFQRGEPQINFSKGGVRVTQKGTYKPFKDIDNHYNIT